MSKTIAVDFDGVISKYDKFLGKGVFSPPVDGVAKGMQELRDAGWIIIVHTTRSETDCILSYMEKYSIPFDFINYNPKNVLLGLSLGKPIADVYLDDRAIRFDGNWGQDIIDNINNAKEWWRDRCQK